MHMKNAYIFHGFLILAQPTYYGIRYALNPTFYRSTSYTWLALALAAWLFIIFGFSVPVLTSPLNDLPSSAEDIIPLGHSRIGKDVQPLENVVKTVAAVPNDGIIVFWDFFYWRQRLLLTSPDAVMEIINTHSYDWEKPKGSRIFLSRVLGEGLIGTEGNEHKVMRKTVAPAFSGRNIRELVTVFWSKGVSLANVMSRGVKESVNGKVEICGHMSRVTLDIIGAACLGVDFDTINGKESRIAQLYSVITGPKRGPVPIFIFINIFVPPVIVRKMYGTVYAAVANATQELKGRVRHLLADKKARMEKGGADQKDIIATVMRSGNFSDQYLCDQLLTFLAAGHETTSSALSWAIWFLTLNPTVQDRLRKECNEYLSGLAVDKVTADTIEEMTYLTAVCNETLRVHPTVPFTARQCSVATKIGNVPIPKGTVAIISPWLINRQTSLWGDDATIFNPERWLGEGTAASTGGATTPYAFQTFLYGPRSCIGQLFSRMEMKCILAALVMRFRFLPSEPDQKVEVGGFLTIKPKNGLTLILQDLSKEAKSGAEKV